MNESTQPAASSPAPVEKDNGFATGGMVVGIVAAVLGLIPFLSIVALPAALVGGPLSGIGFAKSLKPGVGGRGFAIAGIVANLAAAALWFGWLAIWRATFSEV